MKRRDFTVAAVVCILVAAALPQFAAAGHWLGWDGTFPSHINRGHTPALSFYNKANNGSATPLEHARGEWSADAVLDLYNWASDSADVVAWDGAWCTGWSGLMTGASPSAGNHFNQAWVQINTCGNSWAAGAAYAPTRAVACQEIGHAIGGMDHQGPGCMGFTYQGTAPAASNNYNDPQVRSPSAHDREHTGHLWWTLH